MNRPVRIVSVPAGADSTEVRVGPGLLSGAGELLARHVRPGPVLVVTDGNVAPHHLPPALRSLEAAGFEGRAVTLPPGEETKNLDTVRELYAALLREGIDRGSAVVGLGGGVVTDLSGFAAATWLRGIAWLALPTTVLAQVDASVGGKTGVDLREGKNLVGAFHAPVGVIADTETLETLPARQVRNGFAEIVKAAFALDAGLLPALEAAPGRLLSLPGDEIPDLVERAVRAKARVVAGDEREAGPRRVLNFGHTAGHALEAATGYGPVLHGEAVAVGMVAAARISAARGLLAPEAVDRLRAVLRGLGLPVSLGDLPARPDRDRFRRALLRDKKRRGGRLALVLLEAPGRAVIAEDADPDELVEVTYGGGDIS